MMNTHYAFWVRSFEKLYDDGTRISKEDAESSNAHLIGKWQAGDTPILPRADHTAVFQVCYPGLLVGLGYTHMLSKQYIDTEAQFAKLGFMLDSVTGLPYIPGSTVKGIIRSAFYKSPTYTRLIIKSLGIVDQEISNDWVRKLENAIFGSMKLNKDKFEECMGDDVFLDAFPVMQENERPAQLLGFESITPHRAKGGVEYDRLSAPNPLTLLKIMPDAKLLFRFNLTMSEVDGITVSADSKLILFKKLLVELGVGAKVNVGFGGLKEDEQGENAGEYNYPCPATADVRNHAPTERRATATTMTPTGQRAAATTATPTERRAATTTGMTVADTPSHIYEKDEIVEGKLSVNGRVFSIRLTDGRRIDVKFKKGIEKKVNKCVKVKITEIRGTTITAELQE